MKCIQETTQEYYPVFSFSNQQKLCITIADNYFKKDFYYKIYCNILDLDTTKIFIIIDKYYAVEEYNYEQI